MLGWGRCSLELSLPDMQLGMGGEAGAGARKHLTITDPSCGALIARYQTNFGRTCYGNDVNSPGSGRWCEARLAELRGGDARVQMREQSRRGERYVPVRL